MVINFLLMVKASLVQTHEFGRRLFSSNFLSLILPLLSLNSPSFPQMLGLCTTLAVQDIQIQLFLLMFTNRSSLSCVKTLRAWALLQGHLCRGLAGPSNKHLDPEGNLDSSIKILTLFRGERLGESQRARATGFKATNLELELRLCQVF